jgi:hypothetical protein
LPRQHLICHPFERLAEHDKAAADRIARAEMQVAQPPLAASVTPLGCEDDKIERAGELDLQPLLAAPAAA